MAGGGLQLPEWELISDLHLFASGLTIHGLCQPKAFSLAEGVIRYFPLEHSEAIDVN